MWGYGILGKGPQVSDSQHPTLIPQTIFGKTPFSTDTKVIDIKAGMNHFAAITSMPLDLFRNIHIVELRQAHE